MIIFNYMYRDAWNYKTAYSLKFQEQGAISLKEADTSLKKTFDSETYFRAEKIGAPSLIPDGDDYDEEADHPWHEYINLETTDQDPDGQVDPRTLEQFVKDVRKTTHRL